MGQFPRDGNSNAYFLIAINSFSKWVKLKAVPLLHSWWIAEFLYNEVISRWGKLMYVYTNNNSEFTGSFVRLCVGIGIVHHYRTPGNSKANR